MLPSISITTPSYNQGQFLAKTIESVLSQDYPALEYQILDGGSTDDTVDIIRRYAHRLAYFTSRPDHGQSDAVNRGWMRSSGEVISWLNSDDYLLPGALDIIAKEFHTDPNLVALIGTCLIANGDGEIVGNKYARTLDLQRLITTSGGVPGQPAVFLRRSILDEIGYLDTHLHYTMDWEYWIRVALRYHPKRIKVLYDPLAVLRVWEGTKTLNGVSLICDEHRKVLKRIFASGSLPLDIQIRHAEAQAGTYWKQADLEWQSGMVAASRQSARRAAELAPTRHTSRRLGVFLLSTLFSHTIWNKMKLIKLHWQRWMGT